MKACIYIRTCTRERQHNTTSVENQAAFCRELAERHGVDVDEAHVYTDIEKPGDLMPACWSPEGADSRAALSELVFAIESGDLQRVLVRRVDKLGSSSEVLCALLDLFTHYDVYVISSADELTGVQDPRSAFAVSILRPRLQVENDRDRRRREELKVKKMEEVTRLQDRIARLEAEIAEL